MNIAIFSSAFYPHVGGVEELVRQLARAYKDKGHEVIIITNRWPRNLPKFENYQGLQVHRFPMRVPEGGVKAHASYRLTHAAICRQMFNLLRERRIDVLHVHCISSNGFYALLAKRMLRILLVATAHGELTMDAGQIYQCSQFMPRILRELLREADAITACSGQTMNELEDFYGRPFGPRARVVYGGISLADFENSTPYCHSRPYILGIGRHVPQKGFDVLLRAYAAADVGKSDLILAGDGPEKAALERLTTELGVQGRVHFIGRTDRNRTVSLFHGCEFFVLPSRHEPMGIVNLEAMAARKAVIASEVGGVPEIVLGGETGLLVPAEDVRELAGAMSSLASSEGLRGKLGVAGHARAKRFDWPAIADEYLAIYQSVQKAQLACCA